MVEKELLIQNLKAMAYVNPGLAEPLFWIIGVHLPDTVGYIKEAFQEVAEWLKSAEIPKPDKIAFIRHKSIKEAVTEDLEGADEVIDTPEKTIAIRRIE